MYLHIKFADGSNPFVKYGSQREIEKELLKWSCNYKLNVTPFIEEGRLSGYTVLAENKYIANLF